MSCDASAIYEIKVEKSECIHDNFSAANTPQSLMTIFIKITVFFPLSLLIRRTIFHYNKFSPLLTV